MTTASRLLCSIFGASGSSSHQRLPELDTYRGFAVTGVVLFHLLYWYGIRCGWLSSAGPPGAFLLADFGAYGVLFFFMISGFVILLSLLKSNSVADFWFSRFSRLYPTFWLCLAISTAVEFVFQMALPLPRWYDPLIDASIVAFYVRWPLPGIPISNTTADHEFVTPLMDGSYWTLAPEMTFYLLLSVVFSAGVLARHGRRSSFVALWLCVVWVDRLLSKRLTWWQDNFALNIMRMFLLSDWAHFFAAGMSFFTVMDAESHHMRSIDSEDSTAASDSLTAVHNTTHPGASWFAVLSFLVRHWASMVILCACVVRACVWPSESLSALQSFVFMCITYLLFAFLVYTNLLHRRPILAPLVIVRRVLCTRLLVFMGTISYPLYLVHQYASFAVMALLVGSKGEPSIVDRTAFLSCAPHDALLPWLNETFLAVFLIGCNIALAALISYWWEQPLMAFLRRWYSRWRQQRLANSSMDATAQLIPRPSV
jgi:peptidoglycan/LPS O-acetylase OafA/YrhL